MQETELTERERWLVDIYERLNQPRDYNPDAIFDQLETRLDEKQAELDHREANRESKRRQRRQHNRGRREVAPQPDLTALTRTAERLERMVETQRSKKRTN